ncbi:MAG: amidase [Granulosicoccus sp.]
MSIEKQNVAATITAIKNGSVTCVDVVNHYNEKIASSENIIGAWEHQDAAFALQQAEQLDNQKPNFQNAAAPLRGIPVGLKDIVDTTDFPTEYGSPIYQGRQPQQDAAVTEKLKAAGAVLMGKTVTTEFAFFNPSRTRNPHNIDHSPGGSSSGSAAAVAAGHIPLAIGSQTGGSVIRPASFCGVFGFKPSRGLVSRRGVLETSTTLDHVGVFAQSLDDIATLTDAISGYDPADDASYEQPRPLLVKQLNTKRSKPPSIVWFDMPYSNRYSDDANVAFEELLSKLDALVIRKDTPAGFSAYLDAHKAIYDYEIVRALDNEIRNHWDNISTSARQIFEKSKNRQDAEYREALQVRKAGIVWFSKLFEQYDAMLTPSAVAEAPLMGSTGDPICCTLFSLTGLPSVNLPILKGKSGLPIGVQLVSAYKNDHLLMSYADQLLSHRGLSI